MGGFLNFGHASFLCCKHSPLRRILVTKAQNLPIANFSQRPCTNLPRYLPRSAFVHCWENKKTENVGKIANRKKVGIKTEIS